MPGVLAFGASLELFLELGPDVVSNRIMDRAGCSAGPRSRCRLAYLRLAPRPRPPAIVALEKPGVDPTRAATELRRQGVVAVVPARPASLQPASVQ